MHLRAQWDCELPWDWKRYEHRGLRYHVSAICWFTWFCAPCRSLMFVIPNAICTPYYSREYWNVHLLLTYFAVKKTRLEADNARVHFSFSYLFEERRRRSAFRHVIIYTSSSRLAVWLDTNPTQQRNNAKTWRQYAGTNSLSQTHFSNERFLHWSDYVKKTVCSFQSAYSVRRDSLSDVLVLLTFKINWITWLDFLLVLRTVIAKIFLLCIWTVVKQMFWFFRLRVVSLEQRVLMFI